MKLNYSKIKAIKPQEKLVKHSDGGGLSLWVYLFGFIPLVKCVGL